MKLATVNPRNRKVQDPFHQLMTEFFPVNSARPLHTNGTRAAINTLEFDDRFELQMALPGFSKENFEVKVEDDQLLVSFDAKTDEASDQNFTRREFGYQTFNRSWNLSDDVDQNKINATYEEGILKISLAKKEEAKKQAPKSIDIL